jgi:hypothetical protein
MNDETSRPESSSSNQPIQPRPNLGGATRRAIQPPINRSQPAQSDTPQMATPPLEPAAPTQPIEQPAKSVQPSEVIETSKVPQQSIEQPIQPSIDAAPEEVAQQAAPASSSIYPSATSGRSAYNPPLPAASEADAKPEPKETKLIETIVMVFGGLMVVVSVLSILEWFSLGVRGANILGVILSFGELFLGTGILRRKEIARTIYVIVAVISLFFSIFGTVSYLNARSTASSGAVTAENSMQSEINNIKNNSNIPASQKDQELTDLEQSLSQVKANNNQVFSVTSLVEGYAISILSLVFLTRPKVKQVFK